jgi:hypothetical protein
MVAECWERPNWLPDPNYQRHLQLLEKLVERCCSLLTNRRLLLMKFQNRLR